MSNALDHLADAADETAAEQRQVARTARRLAREHERGTPWSVMLSGRAGRGLLDLVGTSARRISETTAAFRRVIADALGEEGLTTRQIARLLGVTHQRVSAIRTRRRSSPS